MRTIPEAKDNPMSEFDLQAHHVMHLKELMDKATELDLTDDKTTTAMKNLKVFSETCPPAAEPQPEPAVVPTTRWGKIKCSLVSVLDNETTRTFIKAGGALGGVALVAYSTIHKDHVMERQALAQANQRPS